VRGRLLKETFSKQIIILSLFSFPHVIPILYDIFCILQNSKEDILKNVFIHIESQMGSKQHWTMEFLLNSQKRKKEKKRKTQTMFQKRKN